MLFRVKGHQLRLHPKQLVIPLSLAGAGLLLAKAGFGILSVILLLGLLCLLLRFATKPLARFIARLACSIRWKFEIAIAVIATVSLFTGLISVGAMRAPCTTNSTKSRNWVPPGPLRCYPP